MKKVIVFCLLFLNFSCLNVDGQVELIETESEGLTITGHRGLVGSGLENSLGSIKHALGFDLDRIEIDVHQTKDGRIVVMHDKTIDRTTNGSGTIRNLTYKEISKFGLQAKNSSKVEVIPTLEEVIALVDGKCHLVIEVKEKSNYYLGIEENVNNIITKMDAEEWCIIQSFSDEVLLAFHSLNQNIPLHKLLLSPWFYNFSKLEFVEEFSINQYFISAHLVNKIHSTNKKINAWTVNDKYIFYKLHNKGVDGIITDVAYKFVE